MNPARKTLHGKTETELAALQACQLGNSCSFYAIGAGLRLLLNHSINPLALSDEVNRLWWRGRFMRTFPGWAVTPRMQVRIVRHLARTRNLPINATYQRGDPETLPDILSDDTCTPIITIIWRWRKAPPIYFGDTIQNFNTTRSAGGHTMLLAAFDPGHTAGNQFVTPWGFINPWIDHATQLFWMRDDDFRQAWRFWLPGIGPNPLVLMQSTANH